MKIYLLIAKRFLFPRNDFRSNTINFISFIGLFIGAAAIVLSVSVLNGFQGILQTEAKKIYGDYLVEDISNTSFLRDLNMDNENYSIFQENEFLILRKAAVQFGSVWLNSVPVHSGSGSYRFRFIPVPIHTGSGSYGLRFPVPVPVHGFHDSLNFTNIYNFF